MEQLQLITTPPNLFTARNGLLQTTLRDTSSPLPIASEYPLVLSSKFASRSFCFVDQSDAVIAHANVWIRDVITAKQKTIGKLAVVGNVATAPEHQGKGVMRSLLESLPIADSDGIILWSDLLQFYQKLGYQQLGTELRLVFSAQSTAKIAAATSLRKEPDVEWSASIKPKVPLTLSRSMEEFAELLTIPNTFYFRTDKSFAVFGKGADMLGVIHEWGTTDPSDLLELVRWLVLAISPTPVTLLSPSGLTFARELAAAAVKVESHAMCLARLKDQEKYKELFVWGLDSI
jgi:GNAT superfamily N-acetyltransferase